MSDCAALTAVSCTPIYLSFSSGYLVTSTYNADYMNPNVCNDLISTDYLSIGACLHNGDSTQNIYYEYYVITSVTISGSSVNMYYSGYLDSSCTVLIGYGSAYPGLTACNYGVIIGVSSQVPMPSETNTTTGYLVTTNNAVQGSSFCGPTIASELYTAVGKCFSTKFGSEMQYVNLSSNGIVMQTVVYSFINNNCTGVAFDTTITETSLNIACTSYSFADSLPVIEGTNWGAGFVSSTQYSDTTCQGLVTSVDFNYVGCECQLPPLNPSDVTLIVQSYSTQALQLANNAYVVVVDAYISNGNCTGSPAGTLFVYFNSSECVNGVNTSLVSQVSYPDGGGVLQMYVKMNAMQTFVFVFDNLYS